MSSWEGADPCDGCPRPPDWGSFRVLSGRLLVCNVSPQGRLSLSTSERPLVSVSLREDSVQQCRRPGVRKRQVPSRSPNSAAVRPRTPGCASVFSFPARSSKVKMQNYGSRRFKRDHSVLHVSRHDTAFKTKQTPKTSFWLTFQNPECDFGFSVPVFLNTLKRGSLKINATPRRELG